MEHDSIGSGNLFVKKNRIDVLNLEWASYISRDRISATLVCNYLRYRGYRVKERSVFNGMMYINYLRPTLFFICDSRGAGINLEMMEYAKKRGAAGVTLISEGNFSGDDKKLDQFIWGWNKDKILHEDLHMQWSLRTQKITTSKYPNLKGRVKVSGAVGFDYYKIGANTDKEKLLGRYGKSGFEKVVGVGCWGFGHFFPDYVNYHIYEQIYSKKNCERFVNDGELFNSVLKEVIQKHPDILFLLKEHPGSHSRKGSAIEGLDTYLNTLIIKSEESIHACISVSDFWLTYESTTALEAWMMGKETCLLNPTGVDFPRSNIYSGSPNFQNSKELNEAIHNFYNNGSLPRYSSLNEEREKIVQNTIQWDDGLNHVRAGNEMIDLLNSQPTRKYKAEDSSMKIRRWILAYVWYVRFLLRQVFGPLKRLGIKQKKKPGAEREFHLRELRHFQEALYKRQVAFYERQEREGIEIKSLRAIEG